MLVVSQRFQCLTEGFKHWEKGMTVLVGEIFTFERFSGGHDLDKVLVEHSPGVHQRSKWNSGWFYGVCKSGGEDPPGAMGLLEQLWWFGCVWVCVCMCDCAWWRSIATYSTIIWIWLAVMSSYEIWGHWSLVWLGTWQVYLTHSAKNNVPTVVISIGFPFGNFPPQCLFQVNFLHVNVTYTDHHSRAVTSLRFHRRSPSFILYNNIALQRNPIWRFLNHCYHQATGSTAKKQQHAHKLHTTTWSLSLFLLISLVEP